MVMGILEKLLKTFRPAEPEEDFLESWKKINPEESDGAPQIMRKVRFIRGQRARENR
jgi:hypothetical protein